MYSRKEWERVKMAERVGKGRQVNGFGTDRLIRSNAVGTEFTEKKKVALVSQYSSHSGPYNQVPRPIEDDNLQKVDGH